MSVLQMGPNTYVKGVGAGTKDSPFRLISYNDADEVGRGHVPGSRILILTGEHFANVETGQLGDLSLIPGVVDAPEPGGVQLSLRSDNIADALGGAGAEKVEVHYLDSLYQPQKETVSLNGTNLVNTVATDINVVQFMYVVQLGTTHVALGNISLEALGGGTIYEYIGEGGNQALTSRYCVPAGKRAILQGWHVSGLKQKITFRLRATCHRVSRELLPEVFQFQDAAVCEKVTSGYLQGRGLRFPSLCRIKISCSASANGGEAAGSFIILEEDDD